MHTRGVLGQAFLAALVDMEVSLAISPEVAQAMRLEFDHAVNDVVLRMARERQGVEINLHGSVDWSNVVRTAVQIHLLDCDIHFPFSRAPIQTAQGLSMFLQDVPKYTQPSL